MRSDTCLRCYSALVIAGLSVSLLGACDDAASDPTVDDHDHDHDHDQSDDAAHSHAADTEHDAAGSSGTAAHAASAAADGGGGTSGSSSMQGDASGNAGRDGSATDASTAGSGGNGAGQQAGAHAAGSGGKNASGASGASEAAGAGNSAAGSGGGNSSDIPVRIRFKAKIGADDFACGRDYDAQGKTAIKITPRDLRLFVQDVALLRADGSSVPVRLDARGPWQSEGVALLDFEDGSGQCADGNAEMNSEITGSAPRGEYTGLRFVNGVPEDLDHKDPATQSDPLKTYATLSWGWLTGFRFVKIEVAQVVAAGEPFGDGLLHVGSNACSGSTQNGDVACSKPNRNAIELTSFDTAANTVVVDVGSVFAQTDLTQAADCHSSGSACTPMFDAFGIDFATGKAKAGQTAYRVE